jgi:hypothetical protein
MAPSGIDPATFRFDSAMPQPLRHRVPQQRKEKVLSFFFDTP